MSRPGADARLVLVPVGERSPAGLLTAGQWDALRAVDGVIVTADEEAWRPALSDAWVEVIDLDARRIGRADGDGTASEARLRAAVTGALAGMARVGRGAWLLDAEQRPWARAAVQRALELADADEDDWTLLEAPTAPAPGDASGGETTVETVPALPAAQREIARSLEIMDALRTPGGDAWSAEQTHASLARYLLEEAHEVIEVIEQMPPGPPRDRALVDELGDILFQVLFHARIGQEAHPPWSLADVAAALNRKMERRNPHVFAGDPAAALAERGDVEAIVAQWHAVKRAEGGSGSLFGGIPRELPALQRTAKSVHRARAAGRLSALQAAAREVRAEDEADAGALDVARDLLAVIIEAERQDLDPESALRTLLGRLRAHLEPGADGLASDLGGTDGSPAGPVD